MLVGVDVGGTKILAAAVAAGDLSGPTSPVPLRTKEVPTPTASEEFDAALEEAVVEALGDGHLAAVGIGIPGFVDLGGVARQAPNAPAVIDADLASIVRRRFGVPCMVDNDANCAGRAAARWDAPEARVVVAVTLGTGIGGGVVVDRHVLRGAHGFAAEPGHMIVDRDGAECACGQRGCWEVLASGNGLGRLGRIAAAEGRAPKLLEAAGGSLDLIDGHLVAQLAAAGDESASAIFDDYAGWVAVGIVNLVNLVDPEVIVLGGGVVREGRALTDRVQAALDEYHTIRRGRRTRVIASGMEHMAGALGAVLLAEAAAGWGVV